MTAVAVAHPSTGLSGPAAGRGGVPWATLLPLAVLIAYADGFWLVALRGAVGAVQRTDEPFAEWLRESTLTMPVYLSALLGAALLASRTHRSGRPGRFVPLALVVAAGSLAGTALMLVNSAYDYSLQLGQVDAMARMSNLCGAVCLSDQQHATLTLQLRSDALGAGLLLVTNVVVVGWLLLLRGRRLDLSTASGRGRPRIDDLRLLLVAGLVGSAVIHAAVVPEHLAEWSAAGLFFVVLTAAELAVAVAVTGGARLAPLAAALVSIGPLVLWLVSRSWGLPFGPEPGTPEAVGLADLAACAVEVVTLLAALRLLRRARPVSRSAPVRALPVVMVLAVTCLGLGGADLPVVHAFGVTDGSSMMPDG